MHEKDLMKKSIPLPSDKGTSRFIYVIAGISALGGLLFGYDTGVISGAILFIRQDFSLSDTAVEVVVSSVLLGALIGAAFGGVLADRWGRRKVLIFAAIIFILGAVGTSLAPTLSLLLIGRIIVGIAIGVASFTAPLYISELAPVDKRGGLVSFNQLAITVGIVVSYLVDYALSPIQGWRWMLGLAGIPAGLLAIGLLFLPESPRWLVSHAFVEKAHKVLERIRNKGDIENELQEIQHSLGQQRGEWSELLKPFVRPALIVGIGLAVFQQVSGINTVIYYAPTIFQMAGLKAASVAILATVGVGMINVIMTLVAIWLLDRRGRRPLLLMGLAGMILSLGSMGLAFRLPTSSGIVSWIAMGSLMVYVGSFAIGLGPVFWLLIAEIYPLKIRGLAMSTASMANWGANLLVALTFLTLIRFLGRSETFWFYGIVGIGGWLFAFFLIPETKGRTLEEIEAHWRAGKHPREMQKKTLP
jgi:SP family galactose:H+ symporter-like MFS transporter